MLTANSVLFNVNAGVVIHNLIINLVEEVDHVISGAVEDVAGAVELLGHHTKVAGEGGAVVAKIIDKL